MTVRFLVLAHDAPSQLTELLRLVTGPNAGALVHVDRTSALDPFQRSLSALGTDVRLAARRHDVRWGGFGAVAATLDLLREAVHSAPADHYVLLSGRDLPIRPVEELHEVLAGAEVHMDSFPMPDEARAKPMSRLEQWHVAPRRRHSPLGWRVNQALRHLPARDVAKGLGGAAPYAGSQWWSLSHGCATAVLEFVDSAPRFVRFFRHVAVPDEIFFQTVVAALPGQRTLRPSLTYARWSGGVSPDTLHSGDLEALRATGAFFARKFDLANDDDVLPAVRTRLLGLPA